MEAVPIDVFDFLPVGFGHTDRPASAAFTASRAVVSQVFRDDQGLLAGIFISLSGGFLICHLLILVRVFDGWKAPDRQSNAGGTHLFSPAGPGIKQYITFSVAFHSRESSAKINYA